MLVLSRKENESIVIDGRIEVVVVQVMGDKVRLGVNAPRDVSVHRSEVLARIIKSQEEPDLAKPNPA